MIRTSSGPLTGAILALSGAVLWGTTGTSQALLTGSPAPLAVGGLRSCIGAAALLLFALPRGVVGRLRGLGRGTIGWLLLAGLCVALYQLTFFAAVSLAGVGVGTLVVLGTSPCFAGLASWALRGLRPSRRWALATGLALTGAALLVGGGAEPPAPLGLALALVAGCAFGCYTVAGRQVAEAGVDGLTSTAAIFTLSALVLLAPMLGQSLTFAGHPRNLLVLAWLGVMATALAYLLYQRGMASIDAATAATLALAEPMVANLLAVFVLGEPFTWLMGVGVALVLGGLGLLARA
ncbi:MULTISPECIES: DMT family transporter [unclassified Luteococcus]|uniref:DMT family transporter n=1 Tax=unclassified Luteococcus TaxID=2639923 RepID=UPI00313DF0A5